MTDPIRRPMTTRYERGHLPSESYRTPYVTHRPGYATCHRIESSVGRKDHIGEKEAGQEPDREGETTQDDADH